MKCGTSELGRKLTSEWNSRGVRFPFHLVRWLYAIDGTPIVGYRSETGLFCSKGKKVAGKRARQIIRGNHKLFKSSRLKGANADQRR